MADTDTPFTELIEHTTPSEAAAVLAFAEEQLAETNIIDEGTHQVVAVPSGRRLETIDTEKWLHRPTSKRGTVTLHTGESFARYVNLHQTIASNIYADIHQRAVVGVLNGHHPADAAPDDGDGEAGWGDHRAVLQLHHTPEWKAWAALHGKLGDQVTFASHIDERLIDIVSPPGADLLELAQSFQASTSVQFRRATRLESGETQLTYEEQIDAKAGRKGQIAIPREFVIQLAVFDGGDPVELTARLLYRIRDGHLAIGYSIVRVEDVVREAFTDIVDVIGSETGLSPLFGAAPAAGR